MASIGRWRLAILRAAALLSVVTALLAGTAPPMALRVPVGLLMTLVFPGFAVLSAAAPRLRLSIPERALATVALSICCDVCCGLVLGGTRIGLTPISVALALSLLTAGAASLASIRPARAWSTPGSKVVPKPGRSEPPTAAFRAPSGRGARGRALVATGTAAICALIVVGALLLSQHSTVASRGPTYLSLGTIPSRSSGVGLTVTSHEAKPVTIRITMAQGRTVLAAWTNVRLRPGQSWTRQVKLASPAALGVITTSLFVGSSATATERTVITIG